MPVQFSAANSRASTIQNMMTQLHTNLVAAGWEIVYADADAIGTGTASNPAWSKTTATSVSAGLVIYRMPLVTGFPTRWCLQLNPKWGSIAGLAQLYARTAMDATSGGVLTSPGTEFYVQGNSTNNASTEWYVSTYEHGMLLALPVTNAGWLLGVERRRRLDGTLMDDLTAYVATAAAGSALSSLGGATGWATGAAQARSVAAGESAAQRWAIFAASDGTEPYTLNRMDGATGIPQGPINVSGGTAGMPRLFAFLPTNDSTVGVDSSLFVDGSSRAYHVASAVNLTGAGARTPRIAIAKE